MCVTAETCIAEPAHQCATLPGAACKELRALLADAEKLADSLDDLHRQKVKAQQPARLKLAEVKATLALD